MSEPLETPAEVEQQPQPISDKPPVLHTKQGFTPGGGLKDLDDSQIEGELQAAMSGFTDSELYGEPTRHKRSAGEAKARKKGKVISVRGADIFIEVPGNRSQGMLSAVSFPEGAPAVGAEVEVTVEGYDEANGLLKLSRRGDAVETADWSTVAVGMVVEARVTGTNKGGLSVDVNKIRGFMPISQIDLYRVENAEQFINQKLQCMVTEVIPSERNLVVSRRALLEKQREQDREKIWNELEEGQVREGIVRSVRDFGAFVDLGGVDGLLHVSAMSWQRVDDPRSVVKEGEKVKVAVTKIDRESRKISLSLKQLAASPWDTIDDRFPVNTIVPGRVTKTMEFGAFVELQPGIEGMIHISELAPQRVRRVTDVVQLGQEVQVMILRVDKATRKIGLSLKAAQPKEEAAHEVEEETEVETGSGRPQRQRTTPLRGGIGGQ